MTSVPHMFYICALYPKVLPTVYPLRLKNSPDEQLSSEHVPGNTCIFPRSQQLPRRTERRMLDAFGEIMRVKHTDQMNKWWKSLVKSIVTAVKFS